MRVIIVAGLIVCAAAEFALAVATTLLLTVVGSPLSGVALAAAVVLVLVQLGAGCLFVVAAADPTLPRRLTRRTAAPTLET